jgi:hypothetical protein
MGQGDVTKFRAVLLDAGFASGTASTIANQPPLNGNDAVGGQEGQPGTLPHIRMSPVTLGGNQTSGFLFYFSRLSAASAPQAVPDIGGFTVTIWVRDPNTFNWTAMAPATGLDYYQLWICTDVDAMDGLYFEITNVVFEAQALLYLHFAEQ